MIINIGTTADPDLPIAQSLASGFNGYVVWGPIDLTQINDDVIIIGGQEANQNYNWLVQQGYVPSLRAETTGFGSIFYLKLSGHNVWVITGWDVTDTEAAGIYAINMGLPYVSRVIPRYANLEAIQINFPYASATGMNALNSKIGNVLLQVTDTVGDYGLIDGWVDTQGKNLFILREKNQLRLIAIADDIIVAVIVSIAVLVGLAILGVAFWVSFHEYQVTTRTKVRANEVDSILNNPSLTDDQKTNAIKQYYKGETSIMKQEVKAYSILDYAKWAILLAAIGVGGYYAMRGISQFKKGG